MIFRKSLRKRRLRGARCTAIDIRNSVDGITRLVVCPGRIYARYRKDVAPIFRCRLCRRIHDVPTPGERPLYLPGGPLTGVARLALVEGQL